ncbi:MAG: hypothetical protein ABSF03_03245 [Streptosporangiaceae bacterium]|jgi:hypothetical protein
MERGSTKHGPLHDEELAHETEAMVRGAPKPDHTAEWREAEPVDDPRELFEGEEAFSGEDAIELRSELARLLTRDEFPVDRDGLLAILDDKDATPALVELVRRRLPGGVRYHGTRELLEAVGLAHAEADPGA